MTWNIDIGTIKFCIYIYQILSDMDSDIELLEKRLQKTELIKQEMMQELLTGRIRLVAEYESYSTVAEDTPKYTNIQLILLFMKNIK